MSNTVTLPWPNKSLSPNSRVHWGRKGAIAKAYRYTCSGLAREAKITAPCAIGPIHLWLDFYPPDRRSRDDDNLVAAFKSGRDGLADALGIDDKRFQVHPRIMSEIGGMVKVRLTATIEEGATA